MTNKTKGLVRGSIIGLIIGALVGLFFMFIVKPVHAWDTVGWNYGGYYTGNGYSPCPAGTSCVINAPLTFTSGGYITSTIYINGNSSFPMIQSYAQVLNNNYTEINAALFYTSGSTDCGINEAVSYYKQYLFPVLPYDVYLYIKLPVLCISAGISFNTEQYFPNISNFGRIIIEGPSKIYYQNTTPQAVGFSFSGSDNVGMEVNNVSFIDGSNSLTQGLINFSGAQSSSMSHITYTERNAITGLIFTQGTGNNSPHLTDIISSIQSGTPSIYLELGSLDPLPVLDRLRVGSVFITSTNTSAQNNSIIITGLDSSYGSPYNGQYGLVLYNLNTTTLSAGNIILNGYYENVGAIGIFNSHNVTFQSGTLVPVLNNFIYIDPTSSNISFNNLIASGVAFTNASSSPVMFYNTDMSQFSSITGNYIAYNSNGIISNIPFAINSSGLWITGGVTADSFTSGIAGIDITFPNGDYVDHTGFHAGP